MNKIIELAKRSFKDRRAVLLIYILVSIAFMWMYIALFPSISSQTKQFEDILKAYPESLMKAFNVDLSTYTQIEGFLAAEQFSLIWPIFLIIIATSFGGSSIAGEIEKGTIELLLAQPVSRINIYLSKYLAGLMSIIIFVGITIYIIFPITAIHNIDVKAINFANLSWMVFLFGWAIFSIAMFFTSVFNSKGKVYFLTAGMIVLMYVANIVANLKESLDHIKYFSFFHYFDATKILIHNEIDYWAILVFIAVAVVFTVAGAYIFTKRDVAV